MVKDEPLSDESADVIVLADREEDVSTFAYLSVHVCGLVSDAPIFVSLHTYHPSPHANPLG